MARRPVEDDDGRTVADMSEVRRPSALLPHPGPWKKAQAPDPPPQKVRMDPRERRAMLRGALSAAVLIGLIFAACFAALIALIQWIYG